MPQEGDVSQGFQIKNQDTNCGRNDMSIVLFMNANEKGELFLAFDVILDFISLFVLVLGNMVGTLFKKCPTLGCENSFPRSSESSVYNAPVFLSVFYSR